MSDDAVWDVVVIGAGSAGLPAAIHAADRGARVLLLDADNRIGGTLHWSSGQMSAAGTRLQREKGIDDTPAEHFDDVNRITRGTVDQSVTRLVIDHAAETIDWLADIGYRPLPDHPVAGQTHEPYRVRRYVWGEEAGVSVLRVLEPLLNGHIDSGRVKLQLSTRFEQFICDEAGAVTGVAARNDQGEQVTYTAHNVVLTSGGYAASETLWNKHTGQWPLRSLCNPYSRGDGLEAAEAIGVPIERGDQFLCTFAGYLTDLADSRSAWFFPLAPTDRKPWEIYVNAQGRRFVREDHPSIDHLENHLLNEPDTRMFIVYDEGIRQNAPSFFLPEADGATADRHFGRRPGFWTADSITDLAAQMGVDGQVLQQTVATYNQAVDAGDDPEFGRQHLIRPIGKPPFFGVEAGGVTVVSPGGVAINDRLQVVRGDGTPVPNLFAAGEVCGFARFSGRAFAGGMSLTPALTAGRLLGQKLLPL